MTRTLASERLVILPCARVARLPLAALIIPNPLKIMMSMHQLHHKQSFLGGALANVVHRLLHHRC